MARFKNLREKTTNKKPMQTLPEHSRMDRVQLPSSSSLLRFWGYCAESELLVSQFWPTGMLVASGQFGLTSSHFRCDANQKFGSGPSEPAGFQNAARRELQLAPGSSSRQSCGIEEIFLKSPGHSTWGSSKKDPPWMEA